VDKGDGVGAGGRFMGSGWALVGRRITLFPSHPPLISYFSIRVLVSTY
jgi:hypothetical protein